MIPTLVKASKRKKVASSIFFFLLASLCEIEVIRELKRRIGEPEYIQNYYTEEQIWQMRYGDNMQIIPVNFQKRHRKMLEWTYTLMSKRLVKIHPSLQRLIVSLRTAIVSDDWKLDKQQTSNNDLLDALRLTCLNYEFPES